MADIHQPLHLSTYWFEIKRNDDNSILAQDVGGVRTNFPKDAFYSKGPKPYFKKRGLHNAFDSLLFNEKGVFEGVEAKLKQNKLVVNCGLNFECIETESKAIA